MQLPKHENWTPATTERVKTRCLKLFEEYEQHSCLDENDQETSNRATQAELDGMRLQALISYHDWPRSERPF